MCNLGRVRYMSELARAQKFPITPSFAATVCSLPVTYNQSEYMDFLDHWGTVWVFFSRYRKLHLQPLIIYVHKIWIILLKILFRV